MNHKKIQRLWRAEGLRVRQRRRRQRVGASTAETPSSAAPNMVWAVNFQFDSDERGRPIKVCSIVDEHTREWSAGGRPFDRRREAHRSSQSARRCPRRPSDAALRQRARTEQ